MIGGEWKEYPLKTLSVGGAIFQFFRHYKLFNSVRVDKFLNKYWADKNNGVKTPYSSNTIGWEAQAERFYNQCYSAALKHLEE